MVQEIVKSARSITPMELDGGGVIRWLITHRDGALNFSMRLIEVPSGKSTPDHSHDYEHEMYFIEGDADAIIENRKYKVSNDYFVFIPPNLRHTIIAISDVKLVCMIPIKAAKAILGP
ncbi:MAG: cupin domain-containing protein [Thermoplasmatales archaeon]